MSEKRIELVIPPLGESISEATIAKWLKNPGDRVNADEPLAELETDKVTVSLPAPASGVLLEQRFAPGAVVRVGLSIGSLTAGQAGEARTEPAPAPAKAPSRPPKDKAPAAPAPAPAAPAAPAAAPAAPPSAPPPTAPVAAAPPPAAPAAPASAQAPAAPASAQAPAPAAVPVITNSPAMRQWRREHGMDPAASLFSQTHSAPAPGEAAAESPALEEVVPMSPLRRRIAERLVEAQHTAAILTTFNEVDMNAIMTLRTQHQEEFTKKHGCKLGFMSFFVAACARSLVDFPGLNAEVQKSESGLAVVYKKYYDFGIAVGSGKGLVVPVLRQCDKLSFADIEKGIATLSQKAKENKLTLADLQGGTFSISNGGVYGSMMSTPLLNLPQTGILGMHNIIRRPIAVGDEIQIRPMMYVALSYDHRVVDGREAVSFLVKVKERLEHPERMLFGL
jgi:2-oxoglutarate dehydrogenase E2 component (dihydrolipoamide succinyltransferase)